MPFKRISKLMIVHLVSTAIFWLNYFPPSKPGLGLSNTKVLKQFVPGNVVEYKKVYYLHLVKYVELHEED